MKRNAVLTLATALALMPCSLPASAAAGDVWAALGQSGFGNDAAAMGRAAGARARAACNDHKPDLVLYSDHGWATRTDEDKKALLDGVAEFFDRKQLHGLTTHGLFCQDLPHRLSLPENGFVGVMALGGVTTTCAKVGVAEKGKEDAAYATLAEALKTSYAAASDKGRLIFIFGSCAPANSGEKIVNAFTHTLGQDVQLFGGVTPRLPNWDKGPFNWRAQFFQGELLRETVLAILVTGNFTCTFGMAETSPEMTDTQDPDLVVRSAKTATALALGEKTDDVVVMLVNSSYHRAHSLMKGKKPKGETEVLQQASPSPIFGFSGDGEIGHPATGAPPIAATNNISVCVILKAVSAGK